MKAEPQRSTPSCKRALTGFQTVRWICIRGVGRIESRNEVWSVVAGEKELPHRRRHELISAAHLFPTSHHHVTIPR